MNGKQYSFAELSSKQVINVADGRELGHVCDLTFTSSGRVTGLVVPGKKSFLKSLTNTENIFVPWCNIIKIGTDVILTEMVGGVAVCSAENMQDENPAP